MSGRVVGALGSIAVHAAIVIALTWTPAVPRRPPPKHVTEVRLIKSVGRIRMLDKSDGAAFATRGEGRLSKDRCTGRMFKGIGLHTSWGGLIFEVARGSPAEAAGIRAGDSMVDPSQLDPDAMKVGQVVVIGIERRGTVMNINVVVDDICNDKETTP